MYWHYAFTLRIFHAYRDKFSGPCRIIKVAPVLASPGLTGTERGRRSWLPPSLASGARAGLAPSAAGVAAAARVTNCFPDEANFHLSPPLVGHAMAAGLCASRQRGGGTMRERANVSCCI